MRGTIAVVRVGTQDAARAAYRNNEQAIFKTFTPSTDSITEISRQCKGFGCLYANV